MARSFKDSFFVFMAKVFPKVMGVICENDVSIGDGVGLGLVISNKSKCCR